MQMKCLTGYRFGIRIWKYCCTAKWETLLQ